MAIVGALAACGGRARFEPPAAPDAGLDAEGALEPEPDGGAPDSGCHDDLDHDAHDSPACGGRDCDDHDPSFHPNAPDEGEWTFEAADQEGWAVAPAIAVGADDLPHVVFEDRAAGAVVDAVRIGEDEWQREVVEPGGREPAVAAAAGLEVHVLLVADAGGGSALVRHAVRSAAGWSVTDLSDPIDAPGPGRPAIAARADVLVAAFTDPAPVVRFAERAGDAWRLEEVTADGPSPDDPGVAVALDPDGAPVLAWAAEAGVVVAYRVEDAWTRETLPTGGAASVALAVGAAGPIVTYADPEGALALARRSADEWAIERVDDAGRPGRASALALDGGGSVHVVYFAEESFDTRYATDRYGDWMRVTLDRSGEPFVAIAIDAADAIELAYSTTDSDLHWARHVADDGLDQNCNGLPDDG